MGTRSRTFINTNEDINDLKNCIAMYRQYDGYPSGHGCDLAEFLKPFTIVNGMGLNETRKIANGMDCLAAQMIAHFKDGPGGIYLQTGDWVDGLDYHYIVWKDYNKQLMINCYSSKDTHKKSELLFSGTPTEFLDKYKGTNE